mgnify:CR=1 FL=1
MDRICSILRGLSIIGFAVYLVISAWPISSWGWVITGVLVLAGLGVIENAGKPPLPRGEGVLDRLGDMDDNPMNDPRFWD